jgi:hypothetical protein
MSLLSPRRTVHRRLLGLSAVGGAVALVLTLVPAAPASAAGITGPLIDFQTAYCLDSNYHDPAAANPDQGAVYTLPCNGGLYQQWIFVNNDNPYWVEIQDRQTSYCLDSNYQNPDYPSLGAVYTLPSRRWNRSR